MKTNMNSELEELREKINANEIVLKNAYRKYYNRKYYLEAHGEGIKKYSCQWDLLVDFSMDILLQIAVLIDKDRDNQTCGIADIRDYIEKNPGLLTFASSVYQKSGSKFFNAEKFEEDIAKALSKISLFLSGELAFKIKKARDKYLAHKEVQKDGSFYVIRGINDTEVFKALEDLREINVLLRSTICGISFDLDNSMECLKEASKNFWDSTRRR